MVAYIGPPIALSDVILNPPHALLRQSYAPRHQRRGGAINVDGFGVGWYDHSLRPEPARHRTARPIWADYSFASFAPLVRTTALLSAVRSATPPSPIEETGVAPYTSGPWLFAHNGLIEGYRHGPDGALGVRSELLDLVSAGRRSGIDGASDSEVLFALTLDHLDTGDDPVEAIARTVESTLKLADACLNLLLTDGRRLVATARGESLFTLNSRDAVVVASEPWDDNPAWSRVPEGSLVTAEDSNVRITPL